MTASNIPDSFSPDALQELMESAPLDVVDREVDDETCSSCELHERVTAALEAFEEVAEDALTAKAGVMSILDRMVEWHSTVAQSLIERGETEAAIGWARDAGKFQAALNILQTIQVADDDPTCLVK